MKKFLALVLALVLCFSMAACSSEPAENAGQDGADANEPVVVTMATYGEWPTLCPLTTSVVRGDIVQAVMFDRMFVSKLDGTFEPHLCTGYEMQDDTTMVVHINENAKWHDGEPVVAEDFVWTARAFSNAEVAAPRGWIMKYLTGTDDSSGLETSENSVGCEAIDEHTVAFKFKNAIDPEMFLTQINQYFMPLPSHCFEGMTYAEAANDTEFWNAPIGNGPCIYQSKTDGERIVYTANKDYYMGTPDFDTFIMRVVTNDSMVAGLMNGEIDIVCGGSYGGILSTDWELAQAQSNLVCESTSGYGYALLGMNQTQPYLTPEVCSAINMAIDKQSIVDSVFAGEAELAYSWLPQASKYFDSNLTSMWKYDPEAAKAALDAAGFDYSQTLNLKVSSGSDSNEMTALIIQQNLKDIGVNVEIEIADSTAIIAECNAGTTDMVLMNQSNGADPDSCAISFDLNGSFNFAHITDPSWSELVAQGAAANEFEVRQDIYNQLQERLMTECPYIYLFFSKSLVAYNNRLSNVDITDFMNLEYCVWQWEVA